MNGALRAVSKVAESRLLAGTFFPFFSPVDDFAGGVDGGYVCGLSSSKGRANVSALGMQRRQTRGRLLACDVSNVGVNGDQGLSRLVGASLSPVVVMTQLVAVCAWNLFPGRTVLRCRPSKAAL